MGLIVAALSGCALSESRTATGPTATECWFLPQGTSLEAEQAVTVGGHATRILILHADGATPVRVTLRGHTVLDQVLPPDRNGTGISGTLRCGVSGAVRVTASMGGTRLERDVMIRSDRTVIVIDLGGEISATDGPLLLD